MYRTRDGAIEVLLAHPGGPFWARKDAGVWSIPKGEIKENEDLFLAAKREFEEEVGIAPVGTYIPLGSIKQKGGKVVHAWAFEGNCEPANITSGTFQMEWPPRSGEQKEFPEIDRAEFFSIEQAREKINAAQAEFLDRLKISPSQEGGGAEASERSY